MIRRPVYRVDLTPLPDCDAGGDGIRALRRALKCLLRSYRLRCLSACVVQVPAATSRAIRGNLAAGETTQSLMLCETCLDGAALPWPVRCQECGAIGHPEGGGGDRAGSTAPASDHAVRGSRAPLSSSQPGGQS